MPDWGFAQVDQQWFNTPALLADAQRMYAEVKPLQPKYWRIGAQWSLIAKTRDPGTFVAGTPPTSTGRDWSTLDTALNEGLLLGSEIVLILGVQRASWGGFWFFPGTPGTNADFGNFCAETATRYKPGGVGIRTDGRYATNAGRGVRIFEIWNEQNDQGHDGGQINAKDYTARLTAGYDAIKGVTGLSGTNSTVLFGGTYHVQRIGSWMGYGTASLPEIDFLTQCYTYGAKDHFDAMNVHVYPHLDESDYNGSDVGPVPTMGLDNMKQLVEIHGLMVDKGDGAKTIWVTEAGFPCSLVSEAQQKTYWEALWALLSALPYVQVVLFYCARDGGGAVTSINGSLGAMRYDFSHRPVWDFLESLAPKPVARATATAHVPTIILTPTMPVAMASAVAHVPTVIEPMLRAPAATATAVAYVPGLIFPLITPTPAAATAAAHMPLVPVTYTVPMPTSVLPSGWSTVWGDTATVTSSIMREGARIGANGVYRTIVGNAAPTNTNLQYCKAVMGPDLGAADRGQGPAVAFDSAYTNGVFALGTGFIFGSGGVYSKVGAVFTLEAGWTGNVAVDYVLELRMTTSAGHVVYTLYANGSPTGISWTDTTDKIVPGKFCGVAFQTSMASGGQYRSMGLKGPIIYGDM